MHIIKFVATLTILASTLALSAIEPPTDPLLVFYTSNPYENTPQEINDIINESRQNPVALEKLREYPIAYTYKGLQSMANLGRPQNEIDAERQRRAREMLLTHPDMEQFLSTTLTRMREELIKYHDPANPEYLSSKNKNINAARGYFWVLNFAAQRPGNEAFRHTGEFLFSPYFPKVDADDADYVSPAGYAYGMLATLIEKRLPGERVPKNIEEARRWWKENAHRFGAPPPPEPHDPPVQETPKSALAQLGPLPPPATPPPNTPSPIPAVAATTSEGTLAVSWWLVAVAAALVLIVLMRRKG